MVDPYFTMLWDEDMPSHVANDASGATTTATVIAGELAGLTPPPSPPDSWASRPEADLAIWHQPTLESLMMKSDAVRRRFASDVNAMLRSGSTAGACTTADRPRFRRWRRAAGNTITLSVARDRFAADSALMTRP
jgi:hypothetical protein